MDVTGRRLGWCTRWLAVLVLAGLARVASGQDVRRTPAFREAATLYQSGEHEAALQRMRKLCERTPRN